MKTKTIQKVLTQKFNDWVETIRDPEVQKLVRKNSLISGGCIASMLMGEKVNDYDIYFTNKETVKAVAQYYLSVWQRGDEHVTRDLDAYVLDGADVEAVKEAKTGVALNMTPDRIKIVFPSRGIAKEEGAIDDEAEIEEWPDGKAMVDENSKPKYRPIYITNNAITLSNQIQIILRFYGDAETVHRHYDYVHCTNYWLSSDGKLYLNQPALEAILAKELIYVGSLYPLASVIRTRKFIKRGFTCSAGQYLKMAFQISKLDLTNIAVLEDQLVGVDVGYFTTLVIALANKQEKEPNWQIDYYYLATIIDKIF